MKGLIININNEHFRRFNYDFRAGSHCQQQFQQAYFRYCKKPVSSLISFQIWNQWVGGVRQDLLVFKPLTENVFVGAFFVKQLFFLYSIGAMLVGSVFPQSHLLFEEHLLAQGFTADVVSVIMFIALNLHRASVMYGVRSSISVFQDVPRYNDAIKLAECTATSLQSKECVSVLYEFVGTSVISAFFITSANKADPFVDNVIEPAVLATFYGLYVLYTLPSWFHNGMLFGIMEAFKPANTIFMMYMPFMLQNWLGFTNFDTIPASLPYYGLELLLTTIPQSLFLGTSAFAAVNPGPGPINVDPMEPLTPATPANQTSNSTSNSTGNTTDTTTPPAFVLYI